MIPSEFEGRRASIMASFRKIVLWRLIFLLTSAVSVQVHSQPDTNGNALLFKCIVIVTYSLSKILALAVPVFIFSLPLSIPILALTVNAIAKSQFNTN